MARLSAAYLTMPMVEATDQLRLGVAVGCLRAALTVYQPETHPERWASTQLNLANALVYAPSTHQRWKPGRGGRAVRGGPHHADPASKPLGLARALSNQGNALAHLGAFDQAEAKLYEARFIFEEFEDVDAVPAAHSSPTIVTGSSSRSAEEKSSSPPSRWSSTTGSIPLPPSTRMP